MCRLDYKNIMVPRPTCFCCKSSLSIYRNDSNNDIVFFDNHYYHKSCFLKMNKIIKKCIHCKEDILICDEKDEFIYYDKHYYHTNCFLDWCNATKNKSKKRENAKEHIEEYKYEARTIALELLQKKHISSMDIKKMDIETEEHIDNWFAKSDMDTAIKNEFNLVKLPKVIYPQYLNKIYNGTFKDLHEPIKASVLFDMWNRKIEYLRKQNCKLKSKISDYSSEKIIEIMIKYDLSILVNKYDSYLRWIEKQRILEAEKDIEKQQNIVSKSIVYNNKSNNVNVNDNDDISNLVDDIFG